MATLTDLTTSVQTVTSSGAVAATAGVDVSAVTGDYSVVVEVVSLTASKTARIQLEDTTNGWTTATALDVINVTGTIDSRYDERFTKRKYQLPNSQAGVTNGKFRVNVTAIDSAASLQLHAWLET